jgi:hypothetical protein
VLDITVSMFLCFDMVNFRLRLLYLVKHMFLLHYLKLLIVQFGILVLAARTWWM